MDTAREGLTLVKSGKLSLPRGPKLQLVNGDDERRVVKVLSREELNRIRDAMRQAAVGRRKVIHALVAAGLNPAMLYRIQPDGVVTYAR